MYNFFDIGILTNTNNREKYKYKVFSFFLHMIVSLCSLVPNFSQSRKYLSRKDRKVGGSFIFVFRYFCILEKKLLTIIFRILKIYLRSKICSLLM